MKFERLLRVRGLHEALRFLNSRTAYRFTAIYRFDGDMLRNMHLFDAELPDVRRGDDASMSHTYCSIVEQTQRPFTTDDASKDERLQSHPARNEVASYCGVLLRDSNGKPFGTLCHFDGVACDVPTAELPLMEAAARLVALELDD